MACAGTRSRAPISISDAGTVRVEDKAVDILVNEVYYPSVVNVIYHIGAARMTPLTNGVHVNPSDEIIQLGPLAVRFLITGADANGTIALFELAVPAAQRLAAPAHSHDHYEET